ncbi:hypothetical protein [Moraxella nonliquefaciens]|jgi:hypothetical protein|nr:hypothetical protein [Moraxella nonliquefaciens]
MAALVGGTSLLALVPTVPVVGVVVTKSFVRPTRAGQPIVRQGVFGMIVS